MKSAKEEALRAATSVAPKVEIKILFFPDALSHQGGVNSAEEVLAGWRNQGWQVEGSHGLGTSLCYTMGRVVAPASVAPAPMKVS